MLEFLREFYRDKLAMRQRHVAAARHVKDYEINNAYQYVIAREDAQVAWVHDAVTNLGGRPDDVPEPDVKPEGKGKAALNAILTVDRDMARTFVDKWRPRLEALANARNRSMLRVIIGETLEHQRMFEQALGGRSDVLGRRADGAGTEGDVLPTRWVE
jgi:hypothetical protein